MRKFQFHKGTIRTFLGFPKGQGVGNFNSIKVRLEQQVFLIHDHTISFQFHKGTIRTF